MNSIRSLTVGYQPSHTKPSYTLMSLAAPSVSSAYHSSLTVILFFSIFLLTQFLSPLGKGNNSDYKWSSVTWVKTNQWLHVTATDGTRRTRVEDKPEMCVTKQRQENKYPFCLTSSEKDSTYENVLIAVTLVSQVCHTKVTC